VDLPSGDVPRKERSPAGKPGLKLFFIFFFCCGLVFYFAQARDDGDNSAEYHHGRDRAFDYRDQFMAPGQDPGKAQKNYDGAYDYSGVFTHLSTPYNFLAVDFSG
jgi:hypothetical protein